MRTNPNWERLNVVGKVGTNYLSHDNTYIDLRGGLLAIHEVAPGKFCSTYLPAASIRKISKMRRDGSLLIRAVGAPLLGLIVFAMVITLIQTNVSDESLENSLLAAFAVVLLVLIGGYSLMNFVRFFIAKSTTSLIFSANDGEVELNFWHVPGGSTSLDRIIDSVGISPKQEGEANAVSIAHNWSYVYPAKNAALLMASLYLFFLFLAGPLELLTFMELYDLSWFRVVWLGLPPVVGLLFYFRSRYRLTQKQGASRRAIERFVQGDYTHAKCAIQDILALDSEDQEALSLLSHLYVETDDYAKALKAIDFFDLGDDEIRFEMAQYVDLIRTWREKEPVLQSQLNTQ